MTPGSFDISQAPDNNYEVCNHCVVVHEDDSGKIYFQRSGTVNLTTVNSPPDGVFAGTLVNVELEEVTIDSNYVSTPVPGGGCLRIVSATFNTDNNPVTPSDAPAPATDTQAKWLLWTIRGCQGMSVGLGRT